jgi:hypothetical protein
MASKPLTLEEKAAAGVVGASEVVLETVFPGDDLNFPQDGEIARVHYTCKVRGPCVPVLLVRSGDW